MSVAAAPRIAVVDNYDSFTYNLVHALGIAGAVVDVHRNDAVGRDGLAGYDGIVLSPGPGHPGNDRDFGVCRRLITEPLGVPMLGVCLGMQGMALWTGGTVAAAAEVVHGESSTIELAQHAMFRGVATPAVVGRYHSLCVDAGRLPPEWQPLGSTTDGVLMAMAHRQRPWVGVQFHPESILTPDGPAMVQGFVDMCRRLPPADKTATPAT